MKNIVLDSWALIAFFEGENSASKVEKKLKEGQNKDCHLFLSVVNAGEVWYAVARAHSKKDADTILEEIRHLNITIEPVSWKLAKIAAEFKYDGGISYADCFAAALSKQKKAKLITGDPEFKQLEGKITISWI